ncbi:MAG: domain S-box protein [Rhodospirillales bacterium]|nr:domain S-box protein [Rhodospirillales bacterium]
MNKMRPGESTILQPRQGDAEYEARLRGVVEMAVDPILTIDETGTIETVNAAAQRLFDYAAEEMIGRNIKMLMPEPYRSEHDSYLENYQQTGQRKIIGIGREVLAQKRDGTVFPIDLAVSEVDLGGRRIFTGIIRDISDRRKAEQDLRDSEARLRGVVEMAVDGIITIDEMGTIETVNAAAQRLFGYTALEMVGRNVKMLMPEPYQSEHDGYLGNYRSTGERRIIGIGREVSGRRKDGTVFPIYLAVSEVLLGNRRIFTGIVRDISAQKQAEEDLRISLAEKEMLLREIHHRVKNNLQVIIGLLSLQARTVGPELTAYFQESQERIRAMARVHEQLHLSENVASFDLAGYLERLCDDFARIHGSQGPKFLFRRTRSPVPIAFDAATPVVLILNEVLSNAVKHAFPGGGGEVQIGLSRSGGGLMLQVRDNGVGLPAGRAEQRIKSSMGLRLVEALARQIGAKARFASKSGTVFSLRIPRSAIETPQARSHPSSERVIRS